MIKQVSINILQCSKEKMPFIIKNFHFIQMPKLTQKSVHAFRESLKRIWFNNFSTFSKVIIPTGSIFFRKFIPRISRLN